MILRIIDIVNDWCGKALSMMVLVMAGILCWEVLVRYVFGTPTIWAHEITMHIFGAYGVLGGAYVFLRGEHVRLDLIYLRLPRRGRIIFDSLCLLLFWLLLGTILVEGIDFALLSLARGERVFSPLRSPIFPLKSTIPVAAFLMLLQGTAHYIRNLVMAYGEGEKLK